MKCVCCDFGNENIRDKRSILGIPSLNSTIFNKIAFLNTNITTNTFHLTAASLLAIGTLFALNPSYGLVPTSSPQPGSRNGGNPPEPIVEGLPISRNDENLPPHSSVEALALVPPGLTPVSVFPSFAKPRTNHRAVAVIFKEPDGTVANEYPEGVRLKKREAPLAYPYHIKNYIVDPFKETDWADFWEQVEYDWDTEDFKYYRQETVSAWESLQKNIRCLGPKLTRRHGRKPLPKTSPPEPISWPLLKNRNDQKEILKQEETHEDYFPSRLSSLVQSLPSKLYDFFTVTADERDQQSENEKRPENQKIPEEPDYFPDRLSSLVQSLPSKLYDFFTITPEERELAEYEKTQKRNKRDAPLAYPYHIKNYKVKPFKETDWDDFWAQVKYDWDTDEFEWVRQKNWKRFEKNL